MALLAASTFVHASGDKSPQKHYGLIFGTAYGPDDRPLYGAKVTIHPVGKKNPHWELVSDHRGEFAQRVPPGPKDYSIEGRAEIVAMENGKPQGPKKKLRAETKVHVEAEERQDIGLHFHE
jgi:hypothetical protein